MKKWIEIPFVLQSTSFVFGTVIPSDLWSLSKLFARCEQGLTRGAYAMLFSKNVNINKKCIAFQQF